MIKQIKNRLHIKLLQKFGQINRITLAANFLNGTGIEIGAMNLPLLVTNNTHVRYLDRCTKEISEQIFPDFKGKLVNVDFIADGETMEGISNESNDFIIGNHFFEHCRNPLNTIKNMLRVLKPGGIIFMAIPDKRYTFDINRNVTTIEHLIKDYEVGPEWSDDLHYYDFVKNTSHGFNKTDEQIDEVIRSLKDRNFSIHYHVWDHSAMIEMFSTIRKMQGFNFEILSATAAHKGSNESIFILKKEYD